MWPEQVLVLDDECNISGPYGIPTPGNPHDLGFYQAETYPNYINDWITFSFLSPDKERNYLDLLTFTSTFNRVGLWESQLIHKANQNDRDEEFFRLMALERPFTMKNYNYRARLIYNLAWAYHDYEPYPSPIPELLTYMKSHNLFQKLVAEGITKTTHFLPPKHAKKADPKQRPTFKKSFKFTPV